MLEDYTKRVIMSNNRMNREISNPYTETYKVVTLSVMCIAVPVLFLIVVLKAGWIAASGFVIVIPAAPFFVAWIYKLCRVEIEDAGIFAARPTLGGKKVVFIPFNQIEGVSQHFLQRGRPETVTIRLKTGTELGKIIRFVPERRFLPFREHPIVKELKEMIESRKNVA